MEEVDRQIELLKSSDWEVRRLAMETLVSIRTIAIPALIKALNDSNAEVREVAAEALGEIASNSATNALLILLDDPEYLVRVSAAKSLGKIADDSATDALIKALNDEESIVRWAAANSLGEIGDASAVFALFKTSNDLIVSEVAKEALVKIGTSDASAWINILNNTNSKNREVAAEILAKIGTDAIPTWIKALDDTNVEVRLSTAEALREIATKQPSAHLRGAIPILKRLSRARSEKANWPVYQRALETIEKATAGLKDTPIAITTTVATAQDLPVPVEEAPTTAPAPTVRKGLLQRLSRR